MSKSMVHELIARLEAATGPDRELDALIGIVTRTDWPDTSAEHIGDGIIRDRAGPYAAKPFTASLDAALALVERVLPGCGYNIGREDQCKGGFAAEAYVSGYIGPEGAEGRAWVGPCEHYASAPTPALALCLALLKAVQAQQASESTRKDGARTNPKEHSHG